MIILSNSIAQTLMPGQSATFDMEILKTGCAECHRTNSGSVNLAAKNAIYEINFTGNIGATEEGSCQLGISYENSTLLETTMEATSAAAGDLYNVSCKTALKTCCCDNGYITVTNIGTTELNLSNNSCLFIKRIA